MEKDKESVWLANNLIGNTIEESWENMKEYGSMEIIYMEHFKDEDGWQYDYEITSDKFSGKLHVDVFYTDGVIESAEDVDVWFDEDDDEVLD